MNHSNPLYSKLTFHKLDWLEWFALILSLWFIFSPNPYTLLFSMLLALPIIGLILNGFNGRPSIASLVEIVKKQDGKKYDVSDFIDFPAMAILFRVVHDFDFDDFYALLLPSSIAFGLMLTLLFTTHRPTIVSQSNKNKLWIYSALIFNILIYSFAGTYGVNCVYDKSSPNIYPTKVIEKDIQTGRKNRKTYYITVMPWGHHFDKEKISVGQTKYNSIAIGETVSMELKKGLLNIPWYRVKKYQDW